MILPVIVASITVSASLSIAKKKRGINGGNSIQIKFATIAAIVFDAGWNISEQQVLHWMHAVSSAYSVRGA